MDKKLLLLQFAFITLALAFIVLSYIVYQQQTTINEYYDLMDMINTLFLQQKGVNV
tara:strand:- start:76 stop:243 length:168 start_codon:yes stop_codon:yes gene_type:complete